MTLKSVHLIFITLSLLLSFGFAVWAFVGDTSGIEQNIRLLGGISAVIGVALLVYGVLFLRKFNQRAD